MATLAELQKRKIANAKTLAETQPASKAAQPARSGATDAIGLSEEVSSVVSTLPEIKVPLSRSSTGGTTQLGVSTLLDAEPQFRTELTKTQKFLTRTGLEVGLGLAAAPVTGGASVPAGLIRALPATGRALAAGFPRAVNTAGRVARVAGGETVGGLFSQAFDPREDPLKSSSITGAIGGGFEIFTPRIARAMEGLRRGGFALKEGAGPVVRKLLAKEQAVSPGFFSDNFVIQVLDNVSAKSFFGGSRVRAAREGGAEILEDESRSFLRSLQTFTEGSIEVEDLMRNILEEGVEAFRLTASKKYAFIDELTENGFRVDLTPVIAELQKVVRTFGGSEAVGVLKEIDRLKALGEVGSLNDISFELAANMRSGFLQLIRGSGDPSGVKIASTAGAKLGGRLAPIMDRAMNDSISNLSAKGVFPEELTGNIKQLWREANNFWKRGIKEFNSSLVKALAKDDPKKLAGALLNSPRAVRRIKNLVTKTKDFAGEAAEGTTVGGRKLSGTEVWEEVQGHLINKLAEKTLDASGEISGKKMVRRMITQKEVLTEAMGSEGYANAIKIFDELATAQGSKQATGLPGGMWIQFEQAGVVAGAIGFAFGSTALGVGGVAILTAPGVFAKLMTTPGFTRWALLGLDPKTPPEVMIRAIQQLAAISAREGATVLTNPSDIERVRQQAGASAPLQSFLGGVTSEAP